MDFNQFPNYPQKLDSVSLEDGNGNPIDIQNPLHVNGDSVYAKDVDFTCSDFTDWVGDSEKLFESPFSTSIANNTSNNPKQIKVCFNRTIKALQIGLGENNGGNFSNVKISLEGSGGTTRSIFDQSTDNTKKTSLNAEFINEVFNSILIEFYTTDTISLSNLIIFKARYNTTQIEAVSDSGEAKAVRSTRQGNLKVALAEYQADAFGRLRVSEPYTIFDNSHIYPFSSTLFWSSLINGTGTVVEGNGQSKVTLNVPANNGDYVVWQTKQRFKYQPGKSHMILITGKISTEAQVKKRCGLFDVDNVGLETITNTPQNGIYFENNAGILSWNIANNGVVTETAIRDNWSIDKLDGEGVSGLTLNIDDTNIFFCDLEWLGVGTVRAGFVIDGEIVLCHEFHHASNGFGEVYMRTPNLPVNFTIESVGGAGSLMQICTSIISEGGFNPLGVGSAVANPTGVAVTSGDTELLVGIRLKEDNFDLSIVPEFLSLLTTSNGNSRVLLCINPTYSNTVTWLDKDNSGLQYAYNNDNIVSDRGVVLTELFVANNADNLNVNIENNLRIAKDLQGNRDELWMCVQALGNETYYGSINFRELL